MLSAAKVTAYAEAQGVSPGKHGLSAGNGWWGLRSPGYNQYFAACVFDDGDIYVFGDGVNVSIAVRPALWITMTP